jgi:hypothetical protein
MELSAEAFAKGGDSDLLEERSDVSVSKTNHSIQGALRLE